MKKWLFRIFIVFVVLIVILIFSGWIFLKNQSPEYGEEVAFDQMGAEVNVYFDEFAIPHIYSNSLRDAYRAFGYIHAKERMWQIDLLRRIAPGRLSELFGEPTIETDKFFRTIGIHQQSEMEAKDFLRRTEGQLRDVVMGYIDGINHFIQNGPTPIEYRVLSAEIQPFTLTDIYNIMGYMSFSFNVAHKTEPIADFILQQYGLDYLDQLDLNIDTNTTIIQSYEGHDISHLSLHIHQLFNTLPAPELIGSNSWVVAPQKTSTASVLFANDPHIGFSQPSVWYEAHITVPGYEIYGNHIAGYPIAQIGHTRHHAIGLTMFENDDVDYYREIINPENEEEYWVVDHWEAINIRAEKIKVKDGQDVDFEVRATRHGPLISDVVDHMNPAEAVSMWWVYREFPLRLMEASFKIITGTTIEEVREGASMIHAPGLNVMYGDIDGNIAWWASAKLPKRPSHVNSKLILDGSTGKDDISEYYDFSENPQAENPPQGFVYSANNQSIGTNGVKFPGYYLPEDRARRIYKMLDEKDQWTVSDVKEMILDVTSENVTEISAAILTDINTSNLSEIELKCYDSLKEWDGSYELEDIAPVIYTKLIYNVMSAMMEDELSDRWATFKGTFLYKRSVQPLISNATSPWWDNLQTEESESKNDIINYAFKKTVQDLSEQLGATLENWRWADVHTVTHKHSFDAVPSIKSYFNVGPFPISGSSEVINNTQFTIGSDGTYEVEAGPSCRRVINMNDLNSDSWSILPTGQSGNVFSPHYSDQSAMFVKGEFRRQLMSKVEIVNSFRYHMTFN